MTISQVVLAGTSIISLAAIIIGLVNGFLSALPLKLWRYLISRITLSVTFSPHEQGFNMLRAWLAQHPYASRARSVKMAYNNATDKFVTQPGPGLHYFWHEKSPLWIRYGEKKIESNGGVVGSEDIYIVTMLALHHSKMLNFLNLLSAYQKKDTSQMQVHTWRAGYWNWFGPKKKRSFNTVYLPVKTKKEVLEAIDRFMASEDWYAVRGIPWRLGLLLEGCPGSGKSTLATALAGHYDKSLYSMNLSSVANDDQLLQAFGNASSSAIILIEDVDGFSAAQDRGGIEKEVAVDTASDKYGVRIKHGESDFIQLPGGGFQQISGGTVVGEKNKEQPKGVTISGLLNAIDGVAATEGRILILTTNDVSKLDPALLRSGRIDHKFHIGHLGASEVVTMFRVFYPTAASALADKMFAYAQTRSTSAAAWQRLFIAHYNSVENLFSEVINKA